MAWYRWLLIAAIVIWVLYKIGFFRVVGSVGDDIDIDLD